MSSSITINSNLASLNAQGRLAQSTNALRTSFTRLSSGLRINKASDDAAGLAISESLNVDARVFNQGIRNLNDGLSTLAVADAAVEQLSSIVIRLQELAEQAANGTLGRKQRAALDEEAQTLEEEYFRIAQSTEFNGRYLLRGDYGELRLQAGYGEDGGISSGLGGAVGSGSFEEATTLGFSAALRSITTGDFNSDGIADIAATADLSDYVIVRLGAGEGTFDERLTYQVGDDPRGIGSGDFNSDGHLDLVASSEGDETYSVLFGTGSGTFSLAVSSPAPVQARSITVADLNSDGLDDIAAYSAATGRAHISLALGNGIFDDPVVTQAVGFVAPEAADLNNDGRLDLVMSGSTLDYVSVVLGEGDGSFGARVTYAASGKPVSGAIADLNQDGNLDLITALETDKAVGVLLGTGDGSFGEQVTFATDGAGERVEAGDLNGDGLIDIVMQNSNAIINVLLGDGRGSFETVGSYTVSNGPIDTELADTNGDGVLDIVTAPRSGGAVTVLEAKTVSGVAPLLEFALDTQVGARQALPEFQRKLAQLAEQRGQIGAFQARIGVAIKTLQIEQENYLAARSQITDTDIAHESAALLRNQILQQAGAAVLAQANQAPELALRLLGAI